MSLADAREALRRRENVLEKNAEKHIAWSRGAAPPAGYPQIATWADRLSLMASFGPRFPKNLVRLNVPTPDQAVEHLRSLPHEQRRNAERYVRMTPRQVDTPYRRRFELEFGWSPQSEF